MSKLVTILGPTASGKTAMAIQLAKHFNGEIVCADSRTIYIGMDVGTAKPSKEEQKEIPHHLLSVVKPGQTFSVVEFKKLAQKAIRDIQLRGKVPFLVGGSGMYIDSLLFDYTFERSGRVNRIDTTNLSLEELQHRVEAEYPEIELNNSDAHNKRRLEQILQQGFVKSNNRQTNKIESLVLGIHTEMPTLKKNIAIRTKQMLNNGFIQEVKYLIDNYGDNCVQLQTTGYKEVLDFINSPTSKNELELQINAATYKLAKKQLTWFKRNLAVIWVKNYLEAERSVSDYLGL